MIMWSPLLTKLLNVSCPQLVFTIHLFFKYHITSLWLWKTKVFVYLAEVKTINHKIFLTCWSTRCNGCIYFYRYWKWIGTIVYTSTDYDIIFYFTISWSYSRRKNPTIIM